MGGFSPTTGTNWTPATCGTITLIQTLRTTCSGLGMTRWIEYSCFKIGTCFDFISLQVLYDKVEDGKLVNFDPSALAPLISQYLTQPKPRSFLYQNWTTSGHAWITFCAQGKHDTIPWRSWTSIWTSWQLSEEILQEPPQAPVYQQVSGY